MSIYSHSLFDTNNNIRISSREQYKEEISALGYFLPLQSITPSAQPQVTHTDLYLASGKTSATKEYTSAFNPTASAL